MLTTPEIVPPVGLEMETVGGVVSGGGVDDVVKVAFADTAMLAAASRDLTR